ncbi:MAG: precorrin-2 C(20)-methyltransferase [bacterium]|nr:precorrin-2 C(20)-methyltransferase [bacterium]
MEAGKGSLYNIGVGPGDPELLTLKAVRLMRECPVIAIPGKKKENCVAYQIAVQAVPEIAEKPCLLIDMPMTKDAAILEASHKEAVRQLKEVLAEGRDVAYLTLGDVTVYATALYIHERIQEEGFATWMVNGIPSFCAAAARLNRPLVSGAQELHIIPASYGVEEALKLSGVKVFMKAGSTMKQLKEALKGKAYSVHMVERCTMEGERLAFSAEEIPEDAGYYSLVIVKDAAADRDEEKV